MVDTKLREVCNLNYQANLKFLGAFIWPKVEGEFLHNIAVVVVVGRRNKITKQKNTSNTQVGLLWTKKASSTLKNVQLFSDFASREKMEMMTCYTSVATSDFNFSFLQLQTWLKACQCRNRNLKMDLATDIEPPFNTIIAIPKWMWQQALSRHTFRSRRVQTKKTSSIVCSIVFKFPACNFN